ncbi:MAG: hypothetical protein IJ748_04730 [Bacteroidales bacterium]|nr:hypothetical protein [Bacteroidales bacterium]
MNSDIIEQDNKENKQTNTENRQKQKEQSIRAGRSKIELEQDSQGDESFFLAEQFVHPYFDEDPTLGLLKKDYKEPKTLSRGCCCVPQSYKAVGIQEGNSCEKLHVNNWLRDIKPPSAQGYFDYVEVRFKNSHKDFYKVPEGLEITEGDIVAVEGTPGHDIGIVSLAGELCRIQMKKKKGFNIDNVKKLYRRAKTADIEKWLEVIEKEEETLFETRKMALAENLDMKINDIEYQGDGTKAIFYYTANDRVDFRQLIKNLAERFHIRVEMKQIGARQESSRLGGIGTCGRELCCSTWLNNFSSVGTSMAKVQQLFPNPQKLAGQCGKLKCCLNYEYDVYQDALKDFPETGVALETLKGKGIYHKMDVLKKMMWYSYEGSSDLIAIKVSDVKKIISMNKKNKRPEDLESFKADCK